MVDFDTHVVHAPAVEGDQWENHLGVRFQLTDASAAIRASHFNVLEPFHRAKIYSPNVLLAGSDGAETTFLNRGNQFHTREEDVLRQILIMENEAARDFRYAVGAAEANPLMQARRWAAACFVHVPEAGVDDVPTGSLVDFDCPDIELLSCRREEDALLLRLANTCGSRVKAVLKMFRPISSAELTNLTGKPARSLTLRDGRATVQLRPWDIRQLRVRLL